MQQRLACAQHDGIIENATARFVERKLHKAIERRIGAGIGELLRDGLLYQFIE